MKTGRVLGTPHECIAAMYSTPSLNLPQALTSEGVSGEVLIGGLS